MTIKEAFAIKTKNLLLTDKELDLYLLEAGLDGSAEYVYADHGRPVDLTYAELLLSAIYVSEKREDDVSVKYTADIKGIYSAIMRRWGLIDPFAAGRPTVKRLYV
jgi:hypothetical protein